MSESTFSGSVPWLPLIVLTNYFFIWMSEAAIPFSFDFITSRVMSLLNLEEILLIIFDEADSPPFNLFYSAPLDYAN